MSARTGTAPSWGAVRARRPGGRGGGDRWGPSEIARRTGGHDDGGPAATGYGRRPAGAGSGGDASGGVDGPVAGGLEGCGGLGAVGQAAPQQGRGDREDQRGAQHG